MKCLILGAGPAGLTVANRLQQSGGIEYLVLEKEKCAGGLCRSEIVDGFPVDVGGGHFLDVRHSDVNRFLFQFMPEDEWNLYDRKTTLHVNNYVIGQPIEANIWQMRLDDQVEYLKSIAVAGCNTGQPMPQKFIDWIFWKLGKKIAEDYMIPYNKKMFGEDLDQLGTYWLEKLPDVSFEETLLSCLTRRAYGRDPGHTHFYYPRRYGYGELWLRMAQRLGDHIKYNKSVSKIDFDKKTVATIDGDTYGADIIISTVPWQTFTDISGMPDKLIDGIKKLKYSSVQIDYYPENLNTDSQWIYYPDLSLPYHRILVRHNFCNGSKGYWTETNGVRTEGIKSSGFRYLSKYAYPLNTIDKPDIIKNLLDWCKKYSVYGLGRWGEHSHYNSDVTVGLALELVREVFKT